MKTNLLALTSLRFFAAIAVVLEHYFEFRFGHAGVSFFYILSGFILTYNYHGNVSSISQAHAFFKRRFARIYPLHILTFISAIPIALLIDFRGDLPRALLAGIVNLLLIQSFFPDTSFYFGFNSVSWSISDESFFYLCFPILIYILARTSNVGRLSIALGFFALLSICIFNADALKLSHFSLHWLFYINPFFRIFEFIFGIIAAMLFIKGQREKYGSRAEIVALLLLALSFYVAYKISDNYKAATYGLIFIIPSATLLWVFSNSNGILGNLLHKRIFLLLGEASFALYMTHQLLLRYLVIIFGDENVSRIAAALFAITISIICLIFVEKPMQRYVLQYFKRKERAVDQG